MKSYTLVLLGETLSLPETSLCGRGVKPSRTREGFLENTIEIGCHEGANRTSTWGSTIKRTSRYPPAPLVNTYTQHPRPFERIETVSVRRLNVKEVSNGRVEGVIEKDGPLRGEGYNDPGTPSTRGPTRRRK